MKNRDYLFIWRARLLEKLYSFSVIYGLITLVISCVIIIYSGYYFRVLIYIFIYSSLLFATYRKGLSYTVKVYWLIAISFSIALIILTLEGDLTVGLIWIVFGAFLAVTLLEKRHYIGVMLFGAVIIGLWYLNFFYEFLEPLRHLGGIHLYLRYTNSMVFLLAGIIYVNNHLIKNIAKSLESESRVRRELHKEKITIKNTNDSLVDKIAEIDRLKGKLEVINSKLTDKVEEQKLGIKDTMAELKSEIVKHRRTERELIKVQEELLLTLDKEKALNEMKSKFIAMISHEYRTPLTVLSNSAYLLDKYYESNAKERFYDSLEKVNYSVKVMTSLLEEVIRFGNSDINERENEIVEFDVINQIETVISFFEHQDSKKYNIAIEAQEKPFFIKTDARKLRLILNNLIKNAITFSKDKIDVSINIVKVGHNINIIISDKGIGITEADSKNLFEPFYRGENTIGKSGMGLGLPIAKRYAESLNGDIVFDSQKDKGSNFTIILPNDLD